MNREERFDDIENKIKEAAENNHIVFEEESWKKMEQLLDKEDKKKPFFWLWFLVPVLLASSFGLYMLIKKNDKVLAKNKDENNIEKVNISKYKETQIPTTETTIDNEKNKVKFRNDTVDTTQNTIGIVKPLNLITQNSNVVIRKPKATISYNSTKKEYSVKKSDNNELGSYFAKNENKIEQKSKTKASIKNADATADETVFEKVNNRKKNDTATSQIVNEYVVKEIKEDTKTKASIKNADATESDTVFEKVNNRKKNDTVTAQVVGENVAKEIKKGTSSSSKNTSNKEEKQKVNKTLSRFYILMSAGADIGSLKLFSFKGGSFSPKYGASAGFDINKRVNVQAGVYASNKKYVAGPADYNIKAGTYLSTVPITKVEAACLIYELPIALQYRFLQKKSFNAFVGAGASSYIMKKEDYNYFYKVTTVTNIYGVITTSNRDFEKAYSYSGNQHLFSTAFFSAGIEKNITKKLAIQLEPSVSVPLKGVGDGSVKLFSTALLLGVKYKPFNK